MQPAVEGLGELLARGAFSRLRRVLREEEGFDLDAYRQSYLIRRIRSRLVATGAAPDEYVDTVANDAVERRTLIETLGVNVTSFFRDPAVWRFLEEVALPPLVRSRATAKRPIAGLSAGSAGGQEAYGLAMLLSELAIAAGGARVDVDAFDVDHEALATATRAEYADDALAPLSMAARERYFEETDEGIHRVQPHLRARVRVARRDIVTEPVPRRYDVILCRNMMIYLETAAKERLLAKLHAALADDGLLVLGQSEVVLGANASLFRPVNPRHRVYTKAVDAPWE